MPDIYEPPKSELELSSLDQRDEIKQLIKLNNWDVLKTYFYSSVRNKLIWTLSIIIVGVWHIVGFIGLWVLEFPVHETFIHLASFLGWIVGFFIISTLIGAATLLLNPQWRKGRLGEHTITVTDSHLIEETKFNKTQISWESVRKVGKGSSTFFISHSGTEVFPVPLRCFASKMSWENFYRAIVDRHEKYKIS